MTDIFSGDLSDLALDETSPLPAAKPSAKIAARKPGKAEWFRVSTDPQHRPATFLIYQEQGSRQTYLLTKEIGAHPIMRQVSSRRIAYVASNRNGETFLSLVGAGDDEWSKSARVGHQQAQREWVRLVSDRTAGCYAVVPSGNHEPAEFPDLPYNELLKEAFGETLIDSVQHPVVLDLMGLPPKAA